MIGESGNMKEITVMPKNSDQDSNAYVVTYLTMKHGSNNEVSFDYDKGKLLTAPAEDLIKGSFSKKGDNMQWGSVLWRFAIEGNGCLMRIIIDSATRKASTATMILPQQPLKLPDGSFLNEAYVHQFPSYPFSKGTSQLRSFEELEGDGDLSVIDVSDITGADVKTNEIITHMKSSGSVTNLFGGVGSEFSKYPNLRYLGHGDFLTRPDGMADKDATDRVKALIAQGPDNAPAESKFQPGGTPQGAAAKPVEEDKDKRFAGGMSTEDLSKSNDLLDETDKKLKKLEPTVVKLFGDSGKEASMHNVIMDFYRKKASTLSKKLA